MIKQHKTTQLNWIPVAVGLLAAFTFFMSALVSDRVFDRLPHLEDEIAYLYQARIFAGGQIVIDSPEPANAYWQPFVIDYPATGHRFGKYTPGWPAMLAIGVILGQAWVINGFFGMITVVLVYRIGKEIFNPLTGFFGALLTAFSPAALLLNGTLMGHTVALCFTMLFIYGYWRMEKDSSRLRWAVIAGFALGLLAATRPLTTVSVALPFVAWSAVRTLQVIWTIIRRKSFQWRTFFESLDGNLIKNYSALSVCALIIASSIPLFNWVATGHASTNLYELVWSYDQVGFGDCCGRNFHRLEKAYLHTRFDLSMTASDLFGWQIDPITPEGINHLQNEADYWVSIGYSFVLLPFGIMIGLFGVPYTMRIRDWWLFGLWVLVAVGWVLLPLNLNTAFLGSTVGAILGIPATAPADPTFSWFWIIFSIIWLLAPLILMITSVERPNMRYTWFFVSIVLGIIIIQMLYWIGSQRYSTRYYYEALTGAALLTAIALAWIAQKTNSRVIIGLVVLISVVSLYHYSTPRIMALHQFNFISRERLDELETLRNGDQPVLVIVTGERSGDNSVRWRAYGTLMAVTSPYLNSDIVVVRDYGGMWDRFVAEYPDRQVIELHAVGNDATFVVDSADGTTNP